MIRSVMPHIKFASKTHFVNPKKNRLKRICSKNVNLRSLFELLNLIYLIYSKTFFARPNGHCQTCLQKVSCFAFSVIFISSLCLKKCWISIKLRSLWICCRSPSHTLRVSYSLTHTIKRVSKIISLVLRKFVYKVLLTRLYKLTNSQLLSALLGFFRFLLIIMFSCGKINKQLEESERAMLNKMFSLTERSITM